LFDVVSIEAPDGVVNRIVAFNTAAPDGSTTWPLMLPVFAVWAGAGVCPNSVAVLNKSAILVIHARCHKIFLRGILINDSLS